MKFHVIWPLFYSSINNSIVWYAFFATVNLKQNKILQYFILFLKSQAWLAQGFVTRMKANGKNLDYYFTSSAYQYCLHVMYDCMNADFYSPYMKLRHEIRGWEFKSCRTSLPEFRPELLVSIQDPRTVLTYEPCP